MTCFVIAVSLQSSSFLMHKSNLERPALDLKYYNKIAFYWIGRLQYIMYIALLLRGTYHSTLVCEVPVNLLYSSFLIVSLSQMLQ